MCVTCEEALLLISSWLDDQISETEQAQLSAHLEQCPECRQLMQTLKMTDDRLRDLAEEPPAELHQKIMDAVVLEQPVRKKTRSFRFGSLAAAAALVVLVGVGSMVLPEKQTHVPAEASVMTARSAVPVPTAASETAVSMTAEEMAAAAQHVADTRGAEVALLMEHLPELDDCLCEPQTNGAMLYTLSGSDGARLLCQTHSATLYGPAVTDGNADVSYALVVPQS